MFLFFVFFHKYYLFQRRAGNLPVTGPYCDCQRWATGLISHLSLCDPGEFLVIFKDMIGRKEIKLQAL